MTEALISTRSIDVESVLEEIENAENDALKEEFNDFCNDIYSCKSVIRIKLALHFYQDININGKDQNEINQTDKFILTYFNDINRNLINDYHHILIDHLDCNTKQENNKHFEFINKTIALKCNISKCPQYIRNNRDRQKKQIIKLKHNPETLFYIDLLDTLHCYFIHSTDIGFRMNITLNNNDINDNKMDDTNIDIDSKTSFVDNRIKSMQKALITKRRDLSRIRGLERIENNKFLTNLGSIKSNSNHKNDNDTKTNNNQQSTEEHKNIDEDIKDTDSKEETQEAGHYHFGYRYYYWDYFKWNKDEDWQYNPGYKYCDWYVKKKYKNLKGELLYNGLAVNSYNETILKAQNLYKYSCKIRDTMSDFGWKKDYGISDDEPITLQHIMVVLFYTDYSKISYEFSKTFRRLTADETDKSLKRRNSAFWNWAKLLRETVECFGTKLYESNTQIFYHGVSKIYFTSFVANFCGPTSTTSSIEVATIFSSETGVILELEQVQNHRHLKCFNCSYLSAFGNEDERLFIGGQYKLQFKSILLMDTSENCIYFTKSLSLFDRAINADNLNEIEKRKVSILDYKIVNKLIKCEINDNANHKCNFPDFIIGCFKKFIRSKEVIKISPQHLKRDYGVKFSTLFLHKDVGNLLKFDHIAKIFLYCNEIHSEQTGDITPKYLSELLNMIRVIGKMECVLNSIYLENIEEMPNYLFASLFETEEWEIKKENNYTISLRKIIIRRSISTMIFNGLTRMTSYIN